MTSAVASSDAAQRRFGTNQPLVTIVTPSYNQGPFIERTIRSVLCQDYPNIEYIVLDSMSTDKTKSVLKKYDKYITRIVREKDDGQSFAINRGFSESSGQILAWLNSDDCYSSSRVVSQAVAYLVANSTVDMAYGRRLYIDGHGNFCTSYPYHEFSEDQLRISDFIPQECAFWTREIYDRSGGCIDTTYDFAMDYELFMRFLAHGAKFAAINSVFGLFRYYQDQKSRSLWLDVGIPEVARIHTKYCEGPVSDVRMQKNFVEHFWGVSEMTSPASYKRYHALRGPFSSLAATSRGISQLDAWVSQRDVKILSRCK